MKLYAAAITVFALLAGAFGAAWWRTRALANDRGPVAQRLAAGIEEILKGAPVSEFDLGALYDASGRAALVDPATALPRFHQFPAAEARRLRTAATKCTAVGEPFTDPQLEKAAAWTKHACGGAALAADFFDTAPFMHPGGRSYARLEIQRLTQAGRAADAATFAKAHVGSLHVEELVDAATATKQALVDADPVRTALAALNAEALAALVGHEPVVRMGDRLFFFVPKADAAGGGGLYREYPLKAWDALDVPFHPVVKQRDTVCQFGRGTYCWIYRRAGRAAFYGVGATASLAALSLVLAILAVSRIRLLRRDREDQVFVLRTLTHELRTPATGIGLTLETLRDEFDRLPERSQGAFLKLCDDVQRLTRVIAMSARYLKVHGGTQERFEVSRLDSVKDFLDAILEPFQGKARITLPREDRAFKTDPYWLKVCLVNLVDNALTHGKAPVDVTCGFEGAALKLVVKDAGTLVTADLETLAREASRRDGRGLGLGLGIVLRTVRDLGGSLTLAPQPTTFVLTWRESP